MSQSSKKQLPELLQELGFTPVPASKGYWQFESRMPEQNAGNLWRIARWTVRVQGQQWSTAQLRLELPLDVLIPTLHQESQEAFGPQTLVEIGRGTRQDYWLFFEFTKARFKHPHPLSLSQVPESFYSPLGMAGMQLALGFEKGELLLQLAHHFAVGFVPSQFFLEHHRMLAQAMGADWQQCVEHANIFEHRYPLVWLLQATLQQYGKTQTVAAFCRLYHETTDGEGRSASVQLTPGGWELVMGDDQAYRNTMHKPALEVLEARELRTSFQHLDQHILQGRIEEARTYCERRLEDYGPSLYLLRRLAILSLMQRTNLSATLLNEGLRAEPENKLFLSCDVQSALTQGKAGEQNVLKGLSLIGESVYESIQEPETLKTLEAVLPELLGDAWFFKDPDTAQQCYQRILARRGEDSRLLTKLVLLARHCEFPEQEMATLERLAKVERRPSELGYVYLRLAQLFKGIDDQLVVQHALTSLRYSSWNQDAIQLACLTLIEADKPTEAIQVLTDILNGLGTDPDARRKVELEIAIGSIWENYVDRKDLARERYTRALALAQDELGLKRLVEIGLKLNDPRFLGLAYEKLFTLYLNENNDAVDGAAEKLIELHLTQTQDKESAFNVYWRLGKRRGFAVMYLDRILSWGEFKCQWREFYVDVRQFIQNLSPAPAKGELLVRLADIASMRLKDMAAAVEHLFEAIQLTKLSETHFQTMMDHIERQQTWDMWIEGLRRRLKQVTESDFVVLARKMSTRPDYLSASERIEFGMLLLRREDQLGLQLLNAQIENFVRDDLLKNVQEMVQNVVPLLRDSAARREWLEQTVMRLQKSRHADKIPAIAKIVPLVAQEYTQPQDFNDWLLKLLQDEKDPTVVGSFLQRLVELRRVPAFLQPDSVLLTLQDSIYHQGLYAEHLFTQSKDPDERLKWANRAWALLRRSEGYEARKAPLLVAMAQNEPLSLDDIQILVSSSLKVGQLDDMVNALNTQVGMQKDPTILTAILDHIIKIEWQERKNAKATIAAMRQKSRFSGRALADTIELVQFSIAHGSFKDSMQNLLQLLSLSDVSLGFSQLGPMIDWVQTQEMASTIEARQKLLTIAEEACVQTNDLRALSVVQRMVEYGYKSRRLFEYFMRASLRLADPAEVVKVWYLIVVKMPTEDVAWFMEFSIPEARDRRVLATLETTWRQGIEREFEADISEAKADIITFEYARYLALSQEDNKYARVLWQRLFQKNPREVRVWTYYYPLAKISEPKEDYIDFLAFVVPYLREHPDDLGYLPVALDEAESELRSLLLPSKEFLTREVEEVTRQSQDKAETRSEVIPLPTEMKRDLLPEIPMAAGHNHAGFARRQRTMSSVKAMPQKPPATPVVETPAVPIDWRAAAAEPQTRVDLPYQISHQAFTSELEKHVALQVSSLLSGDLRILDSWPIQPWIHYESTPYPKDYRQHLHKESFDPLLNSEFARLLMMMNPALIFYFRERFEFRSLAKRYQVPEAKLMQARQELDWEDEVIVRSGLPAYKEEFAHSRIRIFHFPALGRELFFDPQEKIIYFDKTFYEKQPPSHLRYRMLWIYRANRLNYYFVMSLDLNKAVVPFLIQCRKRLDRSTLAVLKSSIGLGDDQIETALAKIDRERIRPLLERIDSISRQDMMRTVEAMYAQIFKLMLAESLDLIGLVESITDKNLSEPLVGEMDANIRKNKLVEMLLLTAAQLKFEA